MSVSVTYYIDYPGCRGGENDRSELFTPRSGQASEKFATGPAPYKNRTKDFFLKSSYCNGRAASIKTPGSGLLSIFQRSVELLENVSSKSWLVQNENCPSQITKDVFSTTEGSNRAEPLFEINYSSVVGFRL